MWRHCIMLIFIDGTIEDLLKHGEFFHTNQTYHTYDTTQEDKVLLLTTTYHTRHIEYVFLVSIPMSWSAIPLYPYLSITIGGKLWYSTLLLHVMHLYFSNDILCPNLEKGCLFHGPWYLFNVPGMIWIWMLILYVKPHSCLLIQHWFVVTYRAFSS